MRIISKFKDYYDYLIGVYGQDPLKVLDRTKYKTYDKSSFNAYPRCSVPDDNYVDDIMVYFCGDCYFIGGVEHLHESRKKNKVEWYHTVGNGDKCRHIPDADLIYKDDLICVIKVDEYVIKKKYPSYFEMKDQITAPYHIVKYYCKDEKVQIPILKDICWHKFMSAEDCYLAIENYISKKDVDVPSSPDDTIRFEQKGFKTKESFIRNKK